MALLILVAHRGAVGAWGSGRAVGIQRAGANPRSERGRLLQAKLGQDLRLDQRLLRGPQASVSRGPEPVALHDAQLSFSHLAEPLEGGAELVVAQTRGALQGHSQVSLQPNRHASGNGLAVGGQLDHLAHAGLSQGQKQIKLGLWRAGELEANVLGEKLDAVEIVGRQTVLRGVGRGAAAASGQGDNQHEGEPGGHG
jgi:hypothetical protein